MLPVFEGAVTSSYKTLLSFKWKEIHTLSFQQSENKHNKDTFIKMTWSLLGRSIHEFFSWNITYHNYQIFVPN